MDKEEKKKVTRFLSFVGDIEDKEEAKEYLEHRGYDLEEVEESGATFLNEIVAEARYKEGEKNRDLFNKAQKLLKGLTINNPLEELKRRLETKYKTPNFSFSKLEKISKGDAESMLNDEELLVIIEELEEIDDG